MPVDTAQRAVRRLFGERLRKYREKFHIPVERIARTVGVSRQYIHLVEKGGANVTLDKYVAMLEACGVTFEEFLRSMTWSDIPESHRPAHEWLAEILSSSHTNIIEATLIVLQAQSLMGRMLKGERRDHAPPHPGIREGPEGAMEGRAATSKRSKSSKT